MKLDSNEMLAVSHLPAQELSQSTLLEKYCKGEETTVEEIVDRVVHGLAKDDGQASRFYKAFQSGFVPGGRVVSAAGTSIDATLINCFVAPINDCISSDDPENPGIYNTLLNAAETMRRGGGVGYDFSPIRPNGAIVKGTQSIASGPISYMHVFDQSCATVESAGSRRGAQMGVLRVDHPDIFEFIRAKSGFDIDSINVDEAFKANFKKQMASNMEFQSVIRSGFTKLTNFNMSVGVTNEFMLAVKNDQTVELVHEAQPSPKVFPDAYQRADKKWVYRVIPARSLWAEIMKSTYNRAEPGVLFLDRIKEDNNLAYCEEVNATNPCGEQVLPDNGCCCLGSLNLTKFVRNPFSDHASFDFTAFAEAVGHGVEMLDRVLDVTLWPREEQQLEAERKRRVGLGFMGLGDTLVMLGLKYNSGEARECAARIAEVMRDAAYARSIEMAKTEGAFPLFDADQYLREGSFASRLPEHLKVAIREHGIRNSHLLSIAPTGTIAIAFGDNVSNGIEPAFSWKYKRNKRMPDRTIQQYEVFDHAFRVYEHLFGEVENLQDLPDSFVSALDISAQDHLEMCTAVAPFIDSAISKTINVPEDYPFQAFEDIYLRAWEGGLKGITTYRPNTVLGAVLVADTPSKESDVMPNDLICTEPDRRIEVKLDHEPIEMRWPDRPDLTNGNSSWTFKLKHQKGNCAVTVGHIENGRNHPFEVWIGGDEKPRVLGAIAKTLSMDMRVDDPAWIKFKLDSLADTSGDDGFQLTLGDKECYAPSLVAGLAKIIDHRVQSLGLYDHVNNDQSTMLRSMFAKKEPKTGTDGTMSWSVDIENFSTSDDFHMIIKECNLSDGTRRPFSVWLSGQYPKQLDGLTKLLSIDMRVVDPAWIGKKLRKLLTSSEFGGEFRATVPGTDKKQMYPSTVAYMAALIIHRYVMLGLLDRDGFPVKAGAFEKDSPQEKSKYKALANGEKCVQCGQFAVVRRDGCKVCENCNAVGSCG